MFEKDEQISIKIPYSGNPQPTAVWLKDAEEVKPSATSPYQVEVSNHFVTLKIDKPTTTQSGSYKLNLKNSLGADSCEIKIQITGKLLPAHQVVVLSSSLG